MKEMQLQEAFSDLERRMQHLQLAVYTLLGATRMADPSGELPQSLSRVLQVSIDHLEENGENCSDLRMFQKALTAHDGAPPQLGPKIRLIHSREE